MFPVLTAWLTNLSGAGDRWGRKLWWKWPARRHPWRWERQKLSHPSGSGDERNPVHPLWSWAEGRGWWWHWTALKGNQDFHGHSTHTAEMMTLCLFIRLVLLQVVTPRCMSMSMWTRKWGAGLLEGGGGGGRESDFQCLLINYTVIKTSLT